MATRLSAYVVGPAVLACAFGIAFAVSSYRARLSFAEHGPGRLDEATTLTVAGHAGAKLADRAQIQRVLAILEPQSSAWEKGLIQMEGRYHFFLELPGGVLRRVELDPEFAVCGPYWRRLPPGAYAEVRGVLERWLAAQKQAAPPAAAGDRP